MLKTAGFLATTALGAIMTWAGIVIDARWLLVTGLVLLALAAILLIAHIVRERVRMKRRVSRGDLIGFEIQGHSKGNTFRGNRVVGMGTFLSVDGNIDGMEVSDNFTDADQFANLKGDQKNVRFSRNTQVAKKDDSAE